MSLHRRITAAAAFAVAAVCLIFAPVAYIFTRAKLTEEVKLELTRLARPYLQPHRQGPQPGHVVIPHQGAASGPTRRAGKGPAEESDNAVPNCSNAQPAQQGDGDTQFGGPSGLFQSVCPNGRVIGPSGGGAVLPVTPRVRAVARARSGAFFFAANVKKHHLEIYVVHDHPDNKAVEIAVPLTTTDSALHGLGVTYLLMVAGGIVLAGLLGAVVARGALAPIRRFTSQTEQIASSLDHPRRIDEEGAIEIRRLAASFNQTLTALERSVEAQRHLIADASHELRTPIAALRSNIQIFLEADQLPPAEQEELRDAIMAELDDLTQLVADVLELARGARTDEQVEELELDAIVREATDRAIRRSQTLVFTTDLEPTLINNSADRVSRAVTNVVDNARKWSPRDGTVEITLHDGLLTVRDHGPGFKAEDLPHVFERFYRSDDARRMPGSGLGLAIVKQAAEAHGGFASVTNAPDGGAIVRVSFGPTAGTGGKPAATGAGDAAARS